MDTSREYSSYLITQADASLGIQIIGLKLLELGFFGVKEVNRGH